MSSYTFIAIDVASKTMDLLIENGEISKFKTVPNTLEGAKQVVKLARGYGLPLRVALEATGTYHLLWAHYFHNLEDVEVSVLSPMVVSGMAKALQIRSKSDSIDAKILMTYLTRFEFKRWEPASVAKMEVRSMLRRIAQLTVDCTREKNRLHAHQRDPHGAEQVTQQLEEHIKHLTSLKKELTAQAHCLFEAGSSEQEKQQLKRLQTVPGVGPMIALVLLVEVLDQVHRFSSRQTVAFAGLDVREFSSGESVRRRRRISKGGNSMVRKMLFIATWNFIRKSDSAQVFVEVHRKKGKRKMTTRVAVMRKMLICMHGMLINESDFNDKFFYRPPAASSA